MENSMNSSVKIFCLQMYWSLEPQECVKSESTESFVWKLFEQVVNDAENTTATKVFPLTKSIAIHNSLSFQFSNSSKFCKMFHRILEFHKGVQ